MKNYFVLLFCIFQLSLYSQSGTSITYCKELGNKIEVNVPFDFNKENGIVLRTSFKEDPMQLFAVDTDIVTENKTSIQTNKGVFVFYPCKIVFVPNNSDFLFIIYNFNQ